MRVSLPKFIHRALSQKENSVAANNVDALGRPFRGLLQRWPNLSDFFIALVSFLFNLALWSIDETDNKVLALGSLADVGLYLCVFIGNFALLWRRSHPWQVHTLVLSLSIFLYAVGPVDGLVAMAFSLYALGRHESKRSISLLGVAAALTFQVLKREIILAPQANTIIEAMLLFGLWYLGRRLRFRGEYLRLLEERAEHFERDKTAEAERAVNAERTRIAREMHDIVAHQVSLMTIQAGAARTVATSDPAAASDAIANVEAAGRQTLAEMRHLLNVMRPDHLENTLEPQPSIAGLPKLISQVKEVIPNIQLQQRGDLSQLPKALEISTYRIVQEALTNVIKHAGNKDVAVKVLIAGHPQEVEIVISDNGQGGKAVQSGGHGIVGMAQRVQLLGGRFNAGPRSENGFEVKASLPRNPEEEKC